MPKQKKPTLKRRKDGRYRCTYKGIPFYSRISPEDAFAQREEYRASLKKGFARMLVKEYALPWLKRAYPKGSVKNSTYNGLAIHLQHLVDGIGNKQVAEVLPSDIKQVYADYYAGLANTYIRSAKQLYCALFDSAVADGLIRFNPARDKAAKPPKGNKPKERILSKQEREWIETLCTDHRTWPAVMCMLYAGLRPPEVKALIIERDVDFENDIITVQSAVHINGQKYDFNSEMKTEWSNRRVPLFPPLKEALRGKHGHIITSAHGKPVTIQTWNTAWDSYIFCMETAINGVQKRWYGETKAQKAQKEAGTLPAWIDFDIVPYTLRHAFCAFCRDNEVDINTCRRWMGHADAKMILKVYDSVSTDREKAERQKIEKQWNQVQKEGQTDNEKPPND